MARVCAYHVSGNRTSRTVQSCVSITRVFLISLFFSEYKNGISCRHSFSRREWTPPCPWGVAVATSSCIVAIACSMMYPLENDDCGWVWRWVWYIVWWGHLAHLARGGNIDIDCAAGGVFGQQESLFKYKKEILHFLVQFFWKKGMTRDNPSSSLVAH